MALLEVKNVSKSFSGLTAVDNMSLELYKGEVVGLIGPNGSGKTTLINIISGVYKPDKGKVYLSGKDITKLPPHERCKCGISVTYQLTELFPDLTVEQGVALNVLYGSRNKRSMDEAKEISRKYLEAVNFPEERYDWPIGKISIGERKRLKFAMSFAREPQVLLFDEIFPGLTEGEIKEYIWLLNWYIKEKNPAVLVVEHIMKVIMSICNRVIVMNHGKKIAEGVPEEVANNPDVICAYLGERYKLKR